MHTDPSQLPLHSLQENEFPYSIRELGYQNPYDFTRKHRHSYFELFFIEKGGGHQLIDFINIPLRNQSAYIVFPRQIHLLKREANTSGEILQFSPELLPSSPLALLLEQYALRPRAAILFEESPASLLKMKQSIALLKACQENQSPFAKESGLLILQALLYQILEFNFSPSGSNPIEDGSLHSFRLLLESRFASQRSVRHYARELGISEQKLARLCKQFMGQSPLQVIHERILLEIKRLMGFENASFKEIAYRLGFDSPAAFSQFVKSKTGRTPTRLKQELMEM